MPIWRGKTYDVSELTIDADIPMAGHKLTNLGAAASEKDSLRANADLRAADAALLRDKAPAAPSGIATLNAASTVIQLPAGRGAASGVASLDAASKVEQAPVCRGAASGVASLDASTKIPIAEIPTGTAANNVVKLDATAKLPAVDGSQLTNITAAYWDAIVPDMQVWAGIGDATNPARMNDGLTVTYVAYGVINQYVEIKYSVPVYIGQYRFFEDVDGNSNGDGEVTIQYKNTGGVWTDWKTGIVLGETGAWQVWDDSPDTVIAAGLKVICTKIDTGIVATTKPRELEVKA